MSPSQIGAQLYTLRDFLKTPSDIAKTLARVKQMGYDAVQVSAMGPIEPIELAKILTGEGLACASTHHSLDGLKDVAKTVDYLGVVGCRYPAIGGHSKFWQGPAHQDFLDFARDYSALAKTYAQHKLPLGYHNHAIELAHYNGQAGLDILFEHFDASVWFEIDTYWIQAGGGDPAAWIDKVAGRIPCVHFKDYVVDNKQAPKMCEVGSGNLNWKRILDSCRRAGVVWYLVERDRGDLDPFDSLKVSLDNLRAMGVN